MMVASLGEVALPPDGWRIVMTSAALWQRLSPIEPIVSRQVEEFSASLSRFKLPVRNRCVGRPIRTAPIAGQSSPFFGDALEHSAWQRRQATAWDTQAASTARRSRRWINSAPAAS